MAKDLTYSNRLPKPLVSFVVPAYNEEDNILPLYERVNAVMREIVGKYDHEFIFTDNHSTDGTPDVLARLADKDPRVKVLRFSRNFGFQRSILTGYLHAKGDVAIQLDCDLQDPPELVPQMLAHWEQGYRVVYGIRVSRKEPWHISTARRFFYRLIDFLSEDRLPHDAGDFRLLDRRILHELHQIDDWRPYLRGTIAQLGFSQIGLPYDRPDRQRGVTKFPFRALVGLALDGILNHSIVPLRLATFTGLTLSVVTFIAIIGYTVARVFFDVRWPAGFATTTVLQLFALSVNAMFLGIIGEYLGRVYQQVKRRPLTVVEQSWNVGDATSASRDNHASTVARIAESDSARGP